MTLNVQQQRQEVDNQVQALFAKSAAFQALSPEDRARIQANTSEILNTMAQNKLSQAQHGTGLATMADPYAVPMSYGQPQQGAIPPFTGGTQTGGQAPPFTGGAQPGSQNTFGPTTIGEFGTGVAVGVQQAGELLRQVNFPAFVAELIQGVFQAVVDASIQQMQAFGELVQGVVMSLNDFRDANVTENQARDHLVGKFPNMMQINISDQGPRVGLRPGVDPDEMPNVSEMLGMDEAITDLDDDIIEEQLVPAARNDLARSRQTLLATMLLMGLNRIVVTDGKINAKLKFNFSASDTMQSHAQDYDWENMGMTTAIQSETERSTETGENYKESGYRYRNLSGGSRSGESSRWSKGSYQYTQTPSIYLDKVTDTMTTAELEASAKLSGEVSLNFKSETVDLNQLASGADIFKLERMRSAGRGAPGTPVATPPAGQTPPPAGGSAGGNTPEQTTATA